MVYNHPFASTSVKRGNSNLGLGTYPVSSGVSAAGALKGGGNVIRGAS